MNKLLSQTIESYALALVFISALSWLVGIPVVFEGIQHLIEYSLGMFDSGDGLQKGKEESLRLIAGVGKVASLMFASVVVSRYFLHDKNIKKTLQFNSSAIRSTLYFFLIMGLTLIFFNYGAPLFSNWVDSLGLGLSAKAVALSPIFALLVLAWSLQSLVLKLFASMIEDSEIDWNSKKVVRYWTYQSFPVLVLAIAPLMVLHYYFNWAAVDKEIIVQAVLLTADSLLVGVMAVLIGTATWVTYREAKSQA